MSTEYAWALPSHRAGDGHQVNQKVSERPATLEYLTRVTRAAEDAGFANILVPTGTHCLDSWSLAAAIAQGTRKIKFCVAFRPGITGPVYGAQQANTLDFLTGGRVTINVVTGSTAVDQRRYGDHLLHDERYERTDEFMEIVCRLWAKQGPVTFQGKYYQVEDATIFPNFLSKPYPKIYLAGSSPAGRRTAAKHADVNMMYAVLPEQIAADIREVRSLAAEYGREDRLAYGARLLVCVRESKAEARQAAESLIDESAIEHTQTWADMVKRTESVGQQRVTALASQGDLWVTETIWMGVNRVRGGAGTMLVGTPAMVAGTLRAYVQAGISHFIMNGWPHVEEAEIFGREVLPLLRDTDPVALPEPAATAA